MRRVTILSSALGLLSALGILPAVSSPAEAQESPYVEIADRPLKALSAEQVEDLVEGRGMGLALVAELNGYPGPKHVLELSDGLDLTLEQERSMRAVFEAMQSEAVRLGRDILERERALEGAFASESIDVDSLEDSTEQLGRLYGQLRGVHLAAHLEAIEVLSQHQRHLYTELRGYGTMGAHDPSRHHR